MCLPLMRSSKHYFDLTVLPLVIHAIPIDLLVVDGSAAEWSSAALPLVIHVYLGSVNT